MDAMNALLQMKGVEDLGNIAEGKNNSTYFMPDKDVFSKLVVAVKTLAEKV